MKEKEFTPTTEIGQKIWKLEINIPFEEDRHSICEKGIHNTELFIAYQTKYKIALSDDWITVLDRKEKGKKKESYNRYLNQLEITVKTRDDYFANGIFAHVYSTKKITDKVIDYYKQEIKTQIQKDYAFMYNIDELLKTV